MPSPPRPPPAAAAAPTRPAQPWSETWAVGQVVVRRQQQQAAGDQEPTASTAAAGRQAVHVVIQHTVRQAGSSQVPAGINPRQDTQKEHAVHTCTPCEVVCWWQAARLCRLPENLPPVSCAAVGREYQAVPCAGGSPPFWPSTWVHVCICVHVCMCPCVHVCICVHVHVCVNAVVTVGRAEDPCCAPAALKRPLFGDALMQQGRSNVPAQPTGTPAHTSSIACRVVCRQGWAFLV